MFAVVVDNLSLIGLGCSFIGAVSTLIPNISSIDRHLINTNRMENLSTAHATMLENEELYPNESGFTELNELLEQHVPSKQPPDYLSAPPVGVYGGGGFIKRVYENDSKDDEIVGSQVLVNRWVTQEILSLRTVGERRVLYISMALIATGFALQAIGTLS